MHAWRTAFGVALGRRLPLVDGELHVPGLRRPVSVRRDEWGVPHIDAENEPDTWFALGFCQGQDRGFQLEILVRMIRGTLSELVGEDALETDRLLRRIGFRRSAARQLEMLDTDVRDNMRAFAGGVEAGLTHGVRRRPHELALLRSRRTPWDELDCLGMGKLFAFLMATNWDVELARLQILAADGRDALVAVDPVYASWLPVTTPPGRAAGEVGARLAADLARISELPAPGGGSNCWAVAASRTATGRCLLANDPHLVPSLPPHFYLAHVRCPSFDAAGAALVGAWGIYAGHNDQAGWGVTVGMVDNTDLVLEEIGPDDRSVRRPGGLVPCEVVEETIAVKGARPVVERVLLTPEGPVIGPAPGGGRNAISIRATWLEARPMRGLLDLVKLRTAEDFHGRLGDWPSANQNVVFATVEGHIGWQLVGEAPRRRGLSGAVPGTGHDEAVGWDDVVSFAEMPRALNPDCGWIATANNKPVADDASPFLGNDFADGYRVARIGELLGSRGEWDLAATRRMQLDVTSIPWREMRDAVLATPVDGGQGRTARDLLEGWDGEVTAESTGATVFELFLAALARRALEREAPNSVELVLGRGPVDMVQQTLLGVARSSQLVRLITGGPTGQPVPYASEWIAAALADAGRALDALGDRGACPRWGDVRPLRLVHPAARPPLDRVFGLGPFRAAGDTNTINVAALPLRDPTGNPLFSPALRMTLDIGQWDACRWALPGGQSGNPCSPHYDDQVHAWRDATGVPIAWTEDEQRRTTRHTLWLLPS